MTAALTGSNQSEYTSHQDAQDDASKEVFQQLKYKVLFLESGAGHFLAKLKSPRIENRYEAGGYSLRIKGWKDCAVQVQ